MSLDKASIAVFYHFFPPDEVVSALHIGDLCAGLAERGWRVEAYPSTASSEDTKIRFARREQWRGTSVRRIWRPNFRQASNAGRFFNAIWMIGRWSLLAITIRRPPDVLFVGTDPILSISAARFWKLVHPKIKVVHWCFDMYPEAAIADGLLPPSGFLARLFFRLMRAAYRKCDLIADLGPCMRELHLRHPTEARRETIIPWALEEPKAPLLTPLLERTAVFGDAPLSLLYSGGFGRAHSYEEILRLAELLHPYGAKLVFSVKGKRQEELKRVVQGTNCGIAFAPFAPMDKLQERLACADVHVVTLRSAWTGMVVPSKFFGALAAGRPVLFCGSPKSSLAQWIRKFKLGWVLTPESVQEVAEQLVAYMNSPDEIAAMQRRCFATYREQFSRSSQIGKLDRLLRDLVRGDVSASEAAEPATSQTLL